MHFFHNPAGSGHGLSITWSKPDPFIKWALITYPSPAQSGLRLIQPMSTPAYSPLFFSLTTLPFTFIKKETPLNPQFLSHKFESKI